MARPRHRTADARAQPSILATMTHAGPLVATLVVALSLAFALGFAARLLRLPPLLGYIAAGIAVGPHTPGFVADPAITAALAEIGVALLLFAVGLHFRARDLLAVWRVALPGALAQIAAGTLIGAAAGALALGPGPAPAPVFGPALALSSTAVSTRALEDRTHRGGLAGGAGPGGGAGAGAAAGDGRGIGESRRKARAHGAGTRGIPGRDGVRRARAAAAAARPGGGNRVARVVHPRGDRDRIGHRLRVLGDVRGLAGAGRLLRGRAAGREPPRPPGGGRDRAAAAHIRRAVLRLGRRAGRSGGDGGDARRFARHAAGGAAGPRGPPPRVAAGAAGAAARRDHGGRRDDADRRVLLPARHARHRLGRAAGFGARADPGGGDAHHPGHAPDADPGRPARRAHRGHATHARLAAAARPRAALAAAAAGAVGPRHPGRAWPCGAGGGRGAAPPRPALCGGRGRPPDRRDAAQRGRARGLGRRHPARGAEGRAARDGTADRARPARCRRLPARAGTGARGECRHHRRRPRA